MPEADEDCHIPLVDQRVFGAGVRRKGVAFVPASKSDSDLPQSATLKSNLVDRYLSIVLPKENLSTEATTVQTPDVEPTPQETTLCPVCNQSVSASQNKIVLNAHDSSIAHQVCLEHSFPPSHLDRDHVGLRYLRGYGWDPDNRKGLGAKSEGIRVPVKAKEKHDTTGLRELEDDDDINSATKKISTKPKKKEPVVMLDAGRIRKQELEKKRRAEKLRSVIYGPDLERYLGPDS